MKVVILAGGKGTRISEESINKPKPMINIGGKPILWHIMNHYSYFGYDDFIICLGYKGYMIKEYFNNYFIHNSDIKISLENNNTTVLNRTSDNWKISLIDTGLDTMTGGRIKRIKKFTENKPFLLTYGDGVSNVDIRKLVDFHKKKNKLATLTAVKPPGRFGVIQIDENENIHQFNEKPKESWVNGGFFILEQKIFDYIDNDSSSIWEKDSLEKLAVDNQLCAYKHFGFWRPMDTLRDKIELNELSNLKPPPWNKYE
tara:strand:- start:3817 stop:4587 length:771 start_codon:yes stop_codon:yes gene_type:complete